MLELPARPDASRFPEHAVIDFSALSGNQTEKKAAGRRHRARMAIQGRKLSMPVMTKLPRPSTGPQYDFDDDVTLKFYRLQKISEGSIALSTGDGGVVTGPTAVGTGKNEDPTVELSRLIDIINEKFGTDFKPADELFFSQIREEAVANEELVQAANANTKEHFRFVFQKALEGLFIDRMDQNEELFVKYMNDPTFRKVVDDHLLTQDYDQIREQPAAPG